MFIGYFLNAAKKHPSITNTSGTSLVQNIQCVWRFPDVNRQKRDSTAGVFLWGKGGILVYYPQRQKAAMHGASCIQVQRKQTAVQTQHLNLTTKILSMSTINPRMAVVTPNPFVLQKNINVDKERNLDFSSQKFCNLKRKTPTRRIFELVRFGF